MMTTSNEHNNAPAVPQGWTDADSDAARLALELECLLMDTKDLSVVSKWWGSANDALELHRQRLAATPAPAPAQGEPFGYFRAEPFGWTDCSEDAEGAIALYEHPAKPAQDVQSDPNGWCEYVAGMVFGWLQMQEGLGLTSYDEDRFVEAIAGIVQRRLWAYTPAHPEPVTLTDEQKTWAVNQLMEQAQVFASAWSLVGGKFDFGNALDEAEQAKTELRSMVIAALRVKGGK